MPTSLSTPRVARRTRPLAAQLLAAPVTAVVVVLGVWITGGVISNDFRLSIALTTIWFAISGIACLAIAIRRRSLRVPVLAAYVLTAGVVGAYLGLSTLRDRVVDETVVTGVPAPAASPAAAPDAPPAPTSANVELVRGAFRSGEHDTEGRAAVVRVRDGERFLTLTSFATSAGPDLRVRLVPGRSDDGGAKGAIDLGALKGNRGDQQYRLPSSAQVSGATVVIWCRAFSVPFGSARLA
jgi:Electron transfer DM13